MPRRKAAPIKVDGSLLVDEGRVGPRKSGRLRQRQARMSQVSKEAAKRDSNDDEKDDLDIKPNKCGSSASVGSETMAESHQAEDLDTLNLKTGIYAKSDSLHSTMEDPTMITDAHRNTSDELTPVLSPWPESSTTPAQKLSPGHGTDPTPTQIIGPVPVSDPSPTQIHSLGPVTDPTLTQIHSHMPRGDHAIVALRVAGKILSNLDSLKGKETTPKCSTDIVASAHHRQEACRPVSTGLELVHDHDYLAHSELRTRSNLNDQSFLVKKRKQIILGLKQTEVPHCHGNSQSVPDSTAPWTESQAGTRYLTPSLSSSGDKTDRLLAISLKPIDASIMTSPRENTDPFRLPCSNFGKDPVPVPLPGGDLEDESGVLSLTLPNPTLIQSGLQRTLSLASYQPVSPTISDSSEGAGYDPGACADECKEPDNQIIKTQNVPTTPDTIALVSDGCSDQRSAAGSTKWLDGSLRISENTTREPKVETGHQNQEVIFPGLEQVECIIPGIIVDAQNSPGQHVSGKKPEFPRDAGKTSTCDLTPDERTDVSSGTGEANEAELRPNINRENRDGSPRKDSIYTVNIREKRDGSPREHSICTVNNPKQTSNEDHMSKVSVVTPSAGRGENNENHNNSSNDDKTNTSEPPKKSSQVTTKKQNKKDKAKSKPKKSTKAPKGNISKKKTKEQKKRNESRQNTTSDQSDLDDSSCEATCDSDTDIEVESDHKANKTRKGNKKSNNRKKKTLKVKITKKQKSNTRIKKSMSSGSDCNSLEKTVGGNCVKTKGRKTGVAIRSSNSRTSSLSDESESHSRTSSPESQTPSSPSQRPHSGISRNHQSRLEIQRQKRLERLEEEVFSAALLKWEHYLRLSNEQLRACELKNAEEFNYTEEAAEVIANSDLYVWQLIEQIAPRSVALELDIVNATFL